MSVSLDNINYVTGVDKTFTVTDTVTGWTAKTPTVVISKNKTDRLFEVTGAVATDITFTFTISKAQGKSFLVAPGRYLVRVFLVDGANHSDRGEIHLWVEAGAGSA